MVLAQKALEGKKTAFIWDTLAEAYFRNGLYEKAADAAQNALESAEEGIGIGWKRTLITIRKDSNKWLVNKVNSLTIHQKIPFV
ncbi:MAG: hypothetical protein Ct9H300mP28_15580 [Pseudomonadota bacterium]|nr:MAG: hypothetical protein Ct9H300mP28_15580 [Pseudomonadota bacterium]